MKLAETVTELKSAIDRSAEEQSDGPWQVAAERANLESQGDVGTTSLDESFVGHVENAKVTLQHTWRDTSKTFSPGPDRTRLRLTVEIDGKVVETHVNGWES